MKIVLPRQLAFVGDARFISALFAGIFVFSALGAYTSYSEGEWTGVTFMLWVDQTIINTMIVVMLALLVRPSFRIIYVAIALVAGEALYSNMLLIDGLHGWLSGFGLYHDLLGRHATRAVNPQYAMLIVYALSWLGLLGVVLAKKTRSFDRLMCLVAATAIISTFALFHTFLIGGLAHATNREKDVVTAAFQTIDEAAFRDRCRSMMLRCQVFDRVGALTDRETYEPMLKGPQRTITDIISSGSTFRRPFVWSEQQAAGDGKNTFVAGVIATKDRVLLAMSGERFAETVDYEGERFIIQSLAAHVTWFLIFIGISAIHRRVARPKVRKVLGPNAFS
jgi:hypothetical protein